MDALTAHQPWASLLAHGIQTRETRSWRPPARAVGTRIAIHAGRKVIRDPGEMGWETWEAIRELYGDDWAWSLPTGAVLATALLRTALQVADRDPGVGRAAVWPLGNRALEETIDTEPHGNYSPGRWLWVLEDVRMLAEPAPARGSLGLWQWNPEQEE